MENRQPRGWFFRVGWAFGLALLGALGLYLAWGLGESPARADDLGAFYAPANTTGTLGAPGGAGKKVLINAGRPYGVENARLVGGELWVGLEDGKRQASQSGLGWTALTRKELSGAPKALVTVFVTTPDERANPEVVKTMAENLALLGETRPSKTFPQVVWQRVRFALNQPVLVWVRAQGGMYRPGKEPEYFAQTVAQLEDATVSEEQGRRWLSGVVLPGDDVRAVKWALGEPQNVQETLTGNIRKTVWLYPGFNVVLENNVVKSVGH